MLIAIGPAPALLARDATRTLPIVAVPVDDPVQMGLADSYARPGRNITGLSGAYHGLLSRRLQLLKDLVPDVRRVGILMNPYTLPRATLDQGVDEIRRQLDLAIVVFEARGPEDFDATLAAMARDRLDGVLILADASFLPASHAAGRMVHAAAPAVDLGRQWLSGRGRAGVVPG